MTVKSLIAFSSLSAAPPCFVIPIFADKTSNLSYVQDLTFDGQIKSFMLFDTSLYESVPVLAPSLNISEGSLGIAAFWINATTVITGSLADLSVALAEIDENTLPPFVAVEAMTLVGDQKRLKSSSNRAAKLFSKKENASLFVKRAPKRADNIYALINEQASMLSLSDADSVDDVLRKLQSDLTDVEWSTTWRDAWIRRNYDDRLLGILGWKLYNFPYTQYSQNMLQSVANSRQANHYEFVFKWLESRDFMDGGWRSLWMSLYSSRRGSDEKIFELGLRYLAQSVSNRRALPDHFWSVIWSRVWQYGDYRRELLDLARRVTEFYVSNQDTFITRVILPIIKSDYETPWADAYADVWLTRLYGYRVWMELFVYRINKSHERSTLRELYDLALNWLTHMGQGMNTWAELWFFARSNGSDFISDREFASLAERWLLRARKDLSSWPTVFESLFDLRGNSVSDEMIAAAEMWMTASEGTRRRNPLIRACALGELRLT